MSESKRLHEEFGRLLSPEVVSQLAEEDLLRNQIADVDFVYVLVRNAKSNELCPVNARVAELAISRAFVNHLDGHLTSVAFGIPEPRPDASELRRSFVDELTQHLTDHVSIIHGRRTCFVGNVGSDSLFNYGYAFDDYHHCLRILFELDPGECREV